MPAQSVYTSTTQKAEWQAAVDRMGTTLAAQLRTLMNTWVASVTPTTPTPPPVDPPPATPQPQVGSWVAEYFPNMTLAGAAAMTVREPLGTSAWQLDHVWGNGSPAGLPTDKFSGRFTTLLDVASDGAYVITVNADDGVRVLVDGKSVLEDWTDHSATTRSVTVQLAKGQRRLVVEYYENGGVSVVQAKWAAQIAPPPPPVHPPDTDIRSLLEQPGGRSVRLTAGEYKGGGSGVFPHDKPLVLYADAPGEVGLDLTGTGLTLATGSSNIVLAGIKAYDGNLVSRCDDFTAWWTDHSYPIERWYAEYLAAGGGPDKTDAQKKAAIQRMVHPVCKGVWVGLDAERQVLRNRLLGVDLHDCGDDGAFFNMSSGAEIRGHRAWNIEEKGLDPNVNPWRQNSDLFHCDAVQCPGTSDLVIADGYHQQVCNLGGDNAVGRFTLRNLWVAGCEGVGFIIIGDRGRYCEVSVQDVHGWSNGMGHQTDEGWNTFMTQFIEDKQIVRWGENAVTVVQTQTQGRWVLPERLVVNSGGGNTDRTPWAGFPLNARGYMSDKLAPLNDPQNPALVWRRANPYDSWRNLPGVV